MKILGLSRHFLASLAAAFSPAHFPSAVRFRSDPVPGRHLLITHIFLQVQPQAFYSPRFPHRTRTSSMPLLPARPRLVFSTCKTFSLFPKPSEVCD